MHKAKFKPGDRIVVWITSNKNLKEGDGGTIIDVRQLSNAYYVDAILDTGMRLGNYHEGTFKLETDYDPSIPF